MNTLTERRKNYIWIN